MPTKTIYHRMKALNARMVADYKRGIGPTRMVLLLTTIGRKSGQARITPLQFEQVDGDIYIASARGKDADWFKNIFANQNCMCKFATASSTQQQSQSPTLSASPISLNYGCAGIRL